MNEIIEHVCRFAASYWYIAGSLCFIVGTVVNMVRS